jgi:uncharacterized MAPEG superfamily protein
LCSFFLAFLHFVTAFVAAGQFQIRFSGRGQNQQRGGCGQRADQASANAPDASAGSSP